jgi:hypothetical protein
MSSEIFVANTFPEMQRQSRRPYDSKARIQRPKILKRRKERRFHERDEA